MPARAFSTYAVLMEIQQGMCGAGNYCVHRYGTRSQMRKLNGRTNDGSAAAWPIDSFNHEFIEPITMLDRNGNELAGEIARLTYQASLAPAFAAVGP
jgi:hypothetical protein